MLPLQGSDHLRGRARTDKVYVANILTRLLALGLIETGLKARAVYPQLVVRSMAARKSTRDQETCHSVYRRGRLPLGCQWR